MLSTYLLRLAGVEVWTASLEPSSALVDASRRALRLDGRRPLADLRAETGGFDLVVEAVPATHS